MQMDLCKNLGDLSQIVLKALLLIGNNSYPRKVETQIVF